MRAILTKEQLQLIELFGSEMNMNGRKLIFIPFWFEIDNNVVTAHSLDDLPRDISEHINKLRMSKQIVGNN